MTHNSRGTAPALVPPVAIVDGGADPGRVPTPARSAELRSVAAQADRASVRSSLDVVTLPRTTPPSHRGGGNGPSATRGHRCCMRRWSRVRFAASATRPNRGVWPRPRFAQYRFRARASRQRESRPPPNRHGPRSQKTAGLLLRIWSASTGFARTASSLRNIRGPVGRLHSEV
jgi:hypothetical protein